MKYLTKLSLGYGMRLFVIRKSSTIKYMNNHNPTVYLFMEYTIKSVNFPEIMRQI